MTEHYNKRFFTIIGVLVIIVLTCLYFLTPANELFSSPQKIKTLIDGYGIFGPLALVALNIIQVIISVIPGQAISIAGGYLFGSFLGTIYTLIGTMFGSIFVFWLSKKYGRPLVETFVSKKELAHLNVFFKGKGSYALIIARLIPFFPNDAVSFTVGLTPIKYKKYIIYSIIGFLPHLIFLNILGSELNKGILNPLTISLLLLLSLVGFFYLFRHKLKIFFLKEVRALEKDIEKMQ